MKGDETKERANIRAAMDRLLAGTPLRSDGAVTVVALAVEADVKRHVLTHRHTDLKDEFYAKIRARGQVPDSERKLQEELKKTKERLAEAIKENKKLQAENEAFARVVNVLAVENDQLRGDRGRTRSPVVALPSGREPV
jgi:septal ring factor EnvC (AmiA/AmiB activator)